MGGATAAVLAPAEWCSVAEACRIVGVTSNPMYRAIQKGRVVAHRTTEAGWLVERGSLVAYKAAVASTQAARAATRATAAQTPTRGRCLPAEPLLRFVALAGGPEACGAGKGTAAEQALLRARRLGWVTIEAGDVLAVRLLGRHPSEIWGELVFA